MFRKFYPTICYKTPYIINYNEIYDKGYRGILIDIDNTLVEHGAPATLESDNFFEELRSNGFTTCIISNNSEERVRPFAESSKSLYIFNAGKPGVKSYIKGMELMGTDRNNTLFIGDQMFTDIFGANKTGIRSILVEPVKMDRKFFIMLKRAGEAIVKKFYLRYAIRHPEEL